MNNGTTAVVLSSVTIRYYFTSEGSTDFGFNCYYAQVRATNVTGSFAVTTGVNADHYLEIGFTSGAGVLAPGGNTGEIQTQFHDVNFVNFTQTNDYSYDATKTAFAAWSKVTLFENGTLVWGQEP